MGIAPFSRRLGLVVAVVAVSLLAAGAATGFPGMAADNQPSGDEVLDQVEATYENAETLTGTATVTVANDTDSTTATIDYATKEPDLIAYTVSKDETTYEAGSNGTVGWIVGENRSYARELPTEGEFNASADAELGAYESPSKPVATENVTATLVDTTEMDGESVYVVEIESTAEAAAEASGTVWIATEDYRVRQLTATDGTNETTVEITETRFNVSIHNSTFDPPTDRVSVTTTETYDSYAAVQSATELPLPEYPGEFSEATQLSRADGEAVVQQYETADGTVSVITATGATRYVDRIDSGTNVTIDGQAATAVERDGRATVVWTETGVTTAVAVPGTIEDATAAAREL